MTQHTLVAVFDTPAHAEAAVADLMAANVRADCVSRHNKTPDTTQTTRPAREPGFWESLFGTDPDPYTTVYDRSIESGATVVTVKIEEDQADRVMAILERHHPIDLDERAAGYGVDTSASAMPHTPGATSTAERVASDVKSAVSNAASNVKAAVTGTSSAGTSSTGTSSTGTASTAARSDRESEVIQLAEEQLQVGKRVVSGGYRRPARGQRGLHREDGGNERKPRGTRCLQDRARDRGGSPSQGEHGARRDGARYRAAR